MSHEKKYFVVHCAQTGWAGLSRDISFFDCDRLHGQNLQNNVPSKHICLKR